jgi:hypothetical protein
MFYCLYFYDSPNQEGQVRVFNVLNAADVIELSLHACKEDGVNSLLSRY